VPASPSIEIDRALSVDWPGYSFPPEGRGFGAKIIDRLARIWEWNSLVSKGFSVRNLKYMRAFAEACRDEQFVQQVIAQLPWGHHTRLLDRIKDGSTREWYLRAAIENGWSQNVLVNQIRARLHERQGKALTNFTRALPPELSDLAEQIVRDPHHFDFLALGPDAREHEVGRGFLEHLRDLLVALGRGQADVFGMACCPSGIWDSLRIAICVSARAAGSASTSTCAIASSAKLNRKIRDSFPRAQQ
jgi:predicted nuclease of restriction endonuclease-like (RecB) superfamily